jgi:hypothetical protein
MGSLEYIFIKEADGTVGGGLSENEMSSNFEPAQ